MATYLVAVLPNFRVLLFSFSATAVVVFVLFLAASLTSEEQDRKHYARAYKISAVAFGLLMLLATIIPERNDLKVLLGI